MALYTPVFKEIRTLLYPIIGRYIHRNRYAETIKINEYLMGLKSKDQEKFKLIDFSFSVPYSDDVQEVLVDMIRHSLIKQTDNGYALTNLGNSFIKKGKEEWI